MDLITLDFETYYADAVRDLLALVHDVDALMACLGQYGEISPKSPLADAVMNRLHEIDQK